MLFKGFFTTIITQDFPIRGHRIFLHIRSRRWLNTKTGKVVYRDWAEVGNGTRLINKFPAFLNDISRYQPD
ncbi:ISAon1 family transposase N-terminal region protein [Spirosoma profusum]